MTKSNLILKYPELDLFGKIYGLAPVQAEGTINGYPFYFWAKRDTWSFSISKHSEIYPVNIQDMESGIKYGFYKEAEYGKKGTYSASFMDTKQAEKLIVECCEEFKNTID